MNNIADLHLPGLLKSFGDVKENDWARMKRPYIIVCYLDSQNDLYEDYDMRYFAKMYDGDYFVGYHRVTQTFRELCDDIEKSCPKFQKYPRGAEDPEELICVYM